MVIKPIRNEADYDEALKTIDGLMGAAPNTPDSDTLEVLVTLVEAYEAERWPMESPRSGFDDRTCHGDAWLVSKGFLITTQAKRNLSSRSGIGGVLSAT